MHQGKESEAAVPCERGGHSATLVMNQWLYIFGGNTLTHSFNDTWRINLDEVVADGAADWEEVQALGQVGLRTRTGSTTCRQVV